MNLLLLVYWNWSIYIVQEKSGQGVSGLWVATAFLNLHYSSCWVTEHGGLLSVVMYIYSIPVHIKQKPPCNTWNQRAVVEW